MINKLKKLNFFKRLSLVQQLVVMLSFIGLVLVAIMMPLVDTNLRSIIDEQMYTTLSSSQEIIINNSIMPKFQKSRETYHILYDQSSHSFISTNIPNEAVVMDLYYNLFGTDLTSIVSNEGTTIKNKAEYDRETYYYMITSVNDDQYLVSIQSNEYSNELITSLRNQTIYIQYAFFMIIAIVLILWVMTLINPLKKIKNYIDMIKERKECELIIDRDDEIGIVSQALVDMKEDLEKQESIKEEMIHNISHDLKTPIALIKTYGQSVKDDIYPYGDKESSMDIILENADRLDHKVKSFLFLNRLDYLSGETLEVSQFDMSILIQKIVEQMDALKPNVQLETELESVTFIGTEEHWRIAIENIIDNASRYAESKIHITLKEDYLEIFNDGEPIDEETLPFLFNPYVKGVKGQFGLGLSIVSKIATNFGYDVKAINKEDGVSFIFTKTK